MSNYKKIATYERSITVCLPAHGSHSVRKVSFPDGESIKVGDEIFYVEALRAMLADHDSQFCEETLSRMLGLNPGGEVQGVEFEAAKTTRPIPETHIHRLMTRAECERLDDYLINGTPL